MKTLIGALSLAALLSPVANSAVSATEIKQKLCTQNSVQDKLVSENNRMAFRNKGGLLNQGVCWWHSRFLRNATYLAYFSPEKEPPKDEYVERRIRRPKKGTKTIKVPAPGSVKDIINKIKRGKEPVEIPGYSNLYDFTWDHEDQIQDVLDGWQIEDGFIKQQWIVGLMGESSEEAEILEAIMDDTYRRIQSGELVYQKLQVSGPVAHSWLVQGMIKTETGYDLHIVDSNFTGRRLWIYQKGDTSLSYPGFGNFVPYTEKTGEERRLKRIRNKICK